MDEVRGAMMRDHTTVGIGGPARRIVFPRSVRELQELLAAEARAGRAVVALGGGSNLLVADAGVPFTVAGLKKHLVNVLFAEGGAVVADAGTMLPRLAVLCALSGLSGLEEIGGIPGSVGGALAMNAGSFGRAVGDLVEWVEIVSPDGEVRRVSAREARFAYRTAEFPVPGIVVRAGLRLAAGSPDGVFARLKEHNERRRASQPWGERTFGSTFRNPPGGDAAGALLERAGMKGVREGDAAFSEKHANFIVNRGRARAADVARLIARGREAVRALSGVRLELEVRIWGEVDG